MGARRLADGEAVDPAAEVGADGVLADLHMALMVDGGERFAERLLRLPARAEPPSGRLAPLYLAGVRVEPRRPIETDPPPTAVLRLVAGDAASHRRTLEVLMGSAARIAHPVSTVIHRQRCRDVDPSGDQPSASA